ncbi:MAG: ral nucleoside transport system permease protein, partial [Actinomycetota bacterium]|nr:ral nucleoside transport system permease protein [Actinomycetota bacterium]
CICIFALGLGSKSGYDARFTLSPTGAKITVPTVVMPARLTAIALGVLVAALGGWRIVRDFSRRAMRWVIAFALFSLVFSFMCWALTGQKDNSLDLLGLLQQALILAVPLMLGALAGVLGERSGVINVAIEGQMLTGAFAGALVGTLTHNAGAGIAAAVIAGGLVGLLLALFAIRYFVNQVVLGVVLNLLALGMTGYVYDALMARDQNTYNTPPGLNPIHIAGLADVPIIGPLLFDQNLIVYMTYVLIVVVDIGLFRTRWGLRTRAVGEHPKAADTVGINVRRVRYVNVTLGGLVAGLAGAYLTIGAGLPFAKSMTNGRGFIALAAVIFGRWSPRGAISAALLFGFADALQTVLSFIGTPVAIPSQFLAMLPYLATILAVAGLVGRVRAPAADGEPYEGR